MPFVIYATPYFNDMAVRMISAIGSLPGVTLGVISQDTEANLPEQARAKVASHLRLDNTINTGALVAAARELERRHGSIHRFTGVNENLQVHIAEAREALGVPGMKAAVAESFRDKPTMKAKLLAAGIPAARFRKVIDRNEALAFGEEVGYPLVAKPPAGVASQGTYTALTPDELLRALDQSGLSPEAPVLLEEFITGEEHSFDAVVVRGEPVWHSITNYLPAPLEVVNTPWIQWRVVLPRSLDVPAFHTIRELGFRALAVLGLDTGVCHLEWFEREDGSVVISEVGARPGGAQITTMNARAYDVDMHGAYANLFVNEEFEAPRERKYSVGAAFLRGQGAGHVVRTVRGVEQAASEVGHLVTDVKLPTPGQPRTTSYEGEGFIIARHPDTHVVEEALLRIISLVRVELG